MGLFRAVCAATAATVSLVTAGTVALRAIFVTLRGTIVALTSAQKILNVVMKANPIGLLIGLISGLVAAYATASAASNGFGNTMSAVWSSVVHTAVWGVNKIIESLNWLIAKLNSVGDKVAKFFGGTFTAIQQVDTISAETAQEIVNTGEAMASQISQGISAGNDLSVGGGGTGTGGTDAGGGTGKGGGGDGGADLANEAKQIHEQILQSFHQMQGDQLALIEMQYKKEREELEKSKDANENYHEDLKLLDEVYADKRIKAKQEEFTKLRAIETGIRDMQQDFAFKTSSKDSTGNVSPAVQLATDYANAIDEVEDRYASMVDEFIKMDKMQQQHHIDMLKRTALSSR